MYFDRILDLDFYSYDYNRKTLISVIGTKNIFALNYRTTATENECIIYDLTSIKHKNELQISDKKTTNGCSKFNFRIEQSPISITVNICQ